jgi:hypothetical protein
MASSSRILNTTNLQAPGSLGGAYDGWPGMALKQIMGQIDLLQNMQQQNSTEKSAANLKVLAASGGIGNQVTSTVSVFNRT